MKTFIVQFLQTVTFLIFIKVLQFIKVYQNGSTIIKNSNFVFIPCYIWIYGCILK